MKKILVILGVVLATTTPVLAKGWKTVFVGIGWTTVIDGEGWITLPEDNMAFSFERVAVLEKLIDIILSNDEEALDKFVRHHDPIHTVLRESDADAMRWIKEGKQLWRVKETASIVGPIGCYRVKGETDCRWTIVVQKIQ